MSPAGSQRRLGTLWAAPRFSLTTETGQALSSDALAGRVWLVDFIYTTCPDECPLYLSPKMAAFQSKVLGAGLGGQMALVSITVDPQRDTPSVLAEYARRYGADPQIWHFLTGPGPALDDLLQNGFKVGSALKADPVTVTPTMPGGAPPYTMLHTSTMLLVDRQGMIRSQYDGIDVKVDDLWQDARSLLNQP